jgi:hypothetical protein
MPFEHLARQAAVPRAQFQHPGIGDVGDLLEGDGREAVMVAEHVAGPAQRVDDAALGALVHVIAVEVLQAVGLQHPVEARRLRPATWHA